MLAVAVSEIVWQNNFSAVSLAVSSCTKEANIYIAHGDIDTLYIVYYSQIACKLVNFEKFYLNLQNISLSVYNQNGCIDILYLTSQIFINFRDS